MREGPRRVRAALNDRIPLNEATCLPPVSGEWRLVADSVSSQLDGERLDSLQTCRSPSASASG